VPHDVQIQDRRVGRVLERTLDLPGEQLFEYIDDGEVRRVDSDDVNEYLREISGEEFSSKDFRTWAGTVLAAAALRDAGPFSSAREARRQTVDAIKRVSSQLGNTPAVCRRCYIHPDVLSAHADGSLLKLRLRADGEAEVKNGLREEEKAVLRLLRKRLKQVA
jgi:DNA topoisomerase-1